MVGFRELFTNRQPSVSLRLIRATLRVASLPYGIIVRLRNALYDGKLLRVSQCGLPVVSVGNLSVGGTGKSPTVAWIARWFRNRGVRVAILSRGYKQLEDGRNDEALELELQLPDVPHLQHWDRIASAKLAAEELDMQLLVLDDGFQHRRLARNLDIVLIDATDPLSSHWLLPGGLMRENFASLKRSQVVCLTRADQATRSELQSLRRKIEISAPSALLIEAGHQPTALLSFPNNRQSLDQLSGKRVLAFCAIGNPQSFFKSLENLGAEIVDQRVWPDHHAFTSQDIEVLSEWAEAHKGSDLVCTVKDWVKIQTAQIGEANLMALEIEMKILTGEAALTEKLEVIAALVDRT